MIAGNEVFLRGFGSFIIKQRAEKVARNISKEHNYCDSGSFHPRLQTGKSIPECRKRGKNKGRVKVSFYFVDLYLLAI